MATVEQQRVAVDADAVFDWRFASLRRAGYAPDDAWRLASGKNVDVRLAECLLAQGCPPETALRILI
jgi:hypothetical protein